MVLESGPTIRHRHRIVGAPRSRGHFRRASGEADRWIDGFFLTEPRDTNSHLWRLSCAPCVSPRAARSCATTFLTRPSNDKLGVSKKGLPPLDLPPGLIRKVLSSREPPRAQISIK